MFNVQKREDRRNCQSAVTECSLGERFGDLLYPFQDCENVNFVLKVIHPPEKTSYAFYLRCQITLLSVRRRLHILKIYFIAKGKLSGFDNTHRAQALCVTVFQASMKPLKNGTKVLTPALGTGVVFHA